MTYEYVCSSCGHEWEASQSIKDAPLKTCPKCKRKTAKRQVSGGTGFVLKGSGWYADLYSSAKPDDKKKDKDSDTATSSSESSEGNGKGKKKAGKKEEKKSKPAKSSPAKE
jgi:putative FmdB family regulatory protein